MAASDIRSQLPKNHTVMINVEDSIGEEKRGDNTSGIMLLQADRFRLTQVVSNLLTNAIKFTELGTILVKIETSLTIVVINKPLLASKITARV